jgi:hypothetical protein
MKRGWFFAAVVVLCASCGRKEEAPANAAVAEPPPAKAAVDTRPAIVRANFDQTFIMALG